jgi:hypothetical protein
MTRRKHHALTPCLTLIAALWMIAPTPAAADSSAYEETSVEGSDRGKIQGCALTPIPDIAIDDPKAAMIAIYKARALVTIPDLSRIEERAHFKRDDAEMWILRFGISNMTLDVCDMTAFILKHGDHMYGQELSSLCGSFRASIKERATVTSRDLITGGAPELALAVTTRAHHLCAEDPNDSCMTASSSAYALSLEGDTPRWLAFDVPLSAVFPNPLKPLSLTECPSRDDGFAAKGDAKALVADATKAFSEGRYADAITASQRASAIDTSSAHSFAIARASQKLGDCVSARAFYNDFISVLQDGPRVKLAQQFLDGLGTCDPVPSAATAPSATAQAGGNGEALTTVTCDPELNFINPEDAAIKRASAYCEAKLTEMNGDSDYACALHSTPPDDQGISSDAPALSPHVSFIHESYTPATWSKNQSLAVEANDQLWLLELAASYGGAMIGFPQNESISSATTEDVIPGGQPELVIRLAQEDRSYSNDEEGNINDWYDTETIHERVLVISLDGERPRVVFSAATATTIKDNTLAEGVAEAPPQAASVSWKGGVVSVRAVAGSPPSAKVGDYTLSANGCIAP